MPQANTYTSISNLPTELLALIFEAYQCKGQLAEIIISHVCHAWRSISIGCPKLWSQYAYLNDKRHKHEFDRLVVYLERSRNQPLHLWFMLKSYTFNLDDDSQVLRRQEFDTKESRAFGLFQKATEHAHRWRSISIDIQGKDDSDQRTSSLLLPLQNLSFPNLEAFEVHTPRLSNNIYLDDLFNPEKATPKLSFVRMDPTSFVHFIPPHNITTLELHWEYEDPYPLMPEFFEALWDIMASPTLINLSIIGEMFDLHSIKEFLTKAKPLSTCLKNLRCSSPSFSNIMCRHIHFPRLELLILREVDLWELWEDPIDRNVEIFPALRTLILLNCEGPFMSDLTTLSQYTRNINHLFIVQDADFMEEDPFDLGERSAFFSMVKMSAHIILWPDLDTITFSRPVDYLVSLEEVKSYIDVIQCRSKRCILRLPRYNAELWESVNPTLWTAFSATGQLEIISTDAAKESLGSWVPWPSREVQGIKRPAGDEDPFFNPFCSQEESFSEQFFLGIFARRYSCWREAGYLTWPMLLFRRSVCPS